MNRYKNRKKRNNQIKLNQKERKQSKKKQKENGKYLGKLASGEEVYDRNGKSHIHWEEGITNKILKEALKQIKSDPYEDIIETTVKFDHNIGKVKCVPVDENDDVILVERKGRIGKWVPMVKNKKAIDTNRIFIALKRKRNKKFFVLTAYLTIDDNTEYNQNFWQTHAFIYDEKLIVDPRSLLM